MPRQKGLAQKTRALEGLDDPERRTLLELYCAIEKVAASPWLAAALHTLWSGKAPTHAQVEAEMQRWGHLRDQYDSIRLLLPQESRS